MRVFFWIIILPLLLLAAFFAVSNRESVAVSLWPLSEPIETQLWIVVAAPLYIGFLLGALVAWVSGHGTRARSRAAIRRADTLERDNANLQQQLDQIEVRRPAKPGIIETRIPDSAKAARPDFLP